MLWNWNDLFFLHLIVYFKICRDHTIEKLYSKCQHLQRQCSKLRTVCGNYSESARNFAFFSEKSCPAVITVATNITSGLDIMSYVSKDVRLGYEIGNSREKAETWILLFNRGKLLLLGHLLRCNDTPFTFSPFYLSGSNRYRLFYFPHCQYLLSEYKIKGKCTRVTFPFIQSWDHKIMGPLREPFKNYLADFFH